MRLRSPRWHGALAFLLAASICVSPVTAAPAMAQGSDANTAVAVNDKDGSSVVDIAFQIRRVSSGVVDQTNAAVAYASCESCQTVAIAIQIVLVSGTVDTITPTNLAIAINEECATCQTMALAYQFVFGTGDIIGFTPEGQRRLNEIGKALRDLSRSDLTLDEINAQVLDLTGQIGEILANEVVIRGPAGQRGANPDNKRQGEEQETTPGATVPEGTETDEEAPLDDSEPLPEEEVPEEEAPGSDTGETETAPPTEGPAPTNGSTGTTSP